MKPSNAEDPDYENPNKEIMRVLMKERDILRK